MRIIAGQFRRRKLLANPGLTTRPIADFVKETLFSRLEDRLSGRRIADVFAGTGTIGLEALSRGAASVVFFEKDPRAFELLRRNVAKLEVEAQCFCWRTDLFRCSFRPKGDEARFLPFEWIFFDPPFAMVEKCQPGSEIFRVWQRFAREEISSPDVRLVFRVPTRTDFKMPSAWEEEDHWPFSHMHVFVYRKRGVSKDESSDRESASDPSATDELAGSPAADVADSRHEPEEIA
jgi:16S rRNA (guanine966-N2)-methyltransferase